jgi:hypothetical protein
MDQQGHTEDDFSIVAVDRFILATRDSGYKGTGSAIAELIDNSIQAGARKISIQIEATHVDVRYPLTVTVTDDGVGMDARTLRNALRFGGSSRFDDRAGLGRYGMGLPNSSLSQARHVAVYTWQSRDHLPLWSYLDLDEIAAGNLKRVPSPRRRRGPPSAGLTPSGTVVTWSGCDRLDNRRISTLSRKLQLSIGRRFRYFLWGSVAIHINGDAVEPIDPLYLDARSRFSGATSFADPMPFEVMASLERPDITGVVTVRFSELPVESWSRLSNVEKRERGISKGAGVSVVRAGREVDYGWFFLGGKRRENYDDWWRCEVRFEPELDEAFGITHTKQQIRPMPHLVEAIGGEIEAVARALNARARTAHLGVKQSVKLRDSEQIAAERDRLLTPVPAERRERDERVLAGLHRPALRESPIAGDKTQASGPSYRIVSRKLSETCFFNYARDDGGIVLVLNPDHPFHKIVYRPLLDSAAPEDAVRRQQLELILLAAARSEALLDDEQLSRVAERLRSMWSDTLATLLSR